MGKLTACSVLSRGLRTLDFQLKVLNKNFRIEYIDAEVNGTTDWAGLCCKDDGIILLKPDMNKDLHREVLIHEILHALCDGMGLDLSHKQEERVCNALGKGLAAFVMDNDPKVVKKIFS